MVKSFHVNFKWKKWVLAIEDALEDTSYWYSESNLNRKVPMDSHTCYSENSCYNIDHSVLSLENSLII